MASMPIADTSDAEEARHQRRQELLDGAVRAIEEHGVTASMEQMAAQSGVTKPILYRHFGDRAGLADAMASRYAQGLVDHIVTVLREAPRAEALFATIDAFLTILDEHRDVYRFIIHRPNRPGDAASRGGVIDVIAEAIAETIADQLTRDGRSTDGAHTMAYGIVGMVHYAADEWIESGRLTRTEIATYLTDLLWQGFSGLLGRDPATPAGLANLD